jgi:hypothetical protein
MATRRIFWGFSINRFGIGPLQYISSRSDFGFEFAEIFIIEKRRPTRRVGESIRIPIDTSFFKPLNKSMVWGHGCFKIGSDTGMISISISLRRLASLRFYARQKKVFLYIKGFFTFSSDFLLSFYRACTYIMDCIPQRISHH